jgi:hypothetical protein
VGRDAAQCHGTFDAAGTQRMSGGGAGFGVGGVTGNELILVVPPRQGLASATDYYTTAQDIANLAGTGVALGGDVVGPLADTTVQAIGGHFVDFGGTFATGGAVTVFGSHALLLNITGNTTLTLPTNGTLLTNALASAEIFVGNGSGVATEVAMSGDAEISNTGTVTVLGAGGVGFGSLAFLSAAPAGTLTGTTLASNVVSSSLTEVGTLATGVWNATPLTYPYLPSSADITTIPFPFIGTLPSGQVYAIPLTQAGVLLANGGRGFAYTAGVNPTATQELLVKTIHNGTVTTQGTIVISTAGAVTAPTFSNVSISAGDSVAIVNQGTADVTFASWSFSLQFQKD